MLEVLMGAVDFLSRDLASRHHLYIAAQAADPRRWTRNPRNRTPIGAVTLNPENPELIKTESSNQDKQAIAA